jgi:hypothetical protein
MFTYAILPCCIKQDCHQITSTLRTHKGPEATDAKTDKNTQYNPPSSYVSEKDHLSCK